MDFKQHCENLKIEQAKIHEGIIMDLCVLLHNCADCTECNIKCMVHLLDLCKITKDSFRIPDQYGNKTNRKFLSIAEKNNYIVSFIEVDNGDYYTQFEKL